MKARVVAPKEITGDLAVRWNQIRGTSEHCASPFFSCDFLHAVASVRDDLLVGVLESAGRVVGFFPFHPGRFGLARPLALGLSDFHGVIIEPSLDWCGEDLLRQCGISRWEFDHLVPGQTGFESSIVSTACSPRICFDGGLTGYVDSLNARGRKQRRETERKREKLSSECGDVRFEEHEMSPPLLEQVMAWKSEQCRATGVTDFFAIPWTRRLAACLLEMQRADLKGVLSVLYAGEKVVAVHFGMRNDSVWHFWFPGYHHELRNFSPGMILLDEIISAAASACIRCLDLGAGMSVYKQHVMNDHIMVAAGTVTRPTVINGLIRLADSMEVRHRADWMRPVASIPARVVRRIRRRSRFR